MKCIAPRELAVLDQASRMLAKATSLDEIRSIRDKAEAARTYVKAARLGLELQNQASELKIRAERKAGGCLHTLKLRGGNRRCNGKPANLKLEDLGVSSDQSRRWQRLASVPEEQFEEHLRTVKAQGQELTSASLLRLSRKKDNRSKSAGSEMCIGAVDTIPRPGSILHVFAELSNHFQLLENMLYPVCEAKEMELQIAEKRLIRRLLVEISQLIAEVYTITRGTAAASDTSR